MLACTSSTVNKAKNAAFLAAIMAYFLCLPKSAFSQTPGGKLSPVVIVFGITDTGLKKHATYTQLLNYPSLTCPQAGCEVVDFMISFLPKGEDLAGPYRVKGAIMNQKQIELIRKLKDEKNERTIVYVEDIHAKVDGTIRNMGTVIISCSNN